MPRQLLRDTGLGRSGGGRAGHDRDGGHGDRDDRGGHACDRARGPAAAYRPDAVADLGAAGGGIEPAVGVVRSRAEGGPQVVESVHGSSPSPGTSAGSIRRLASALLSWLLTVPFEQPRR